MFRSLEGYKSSGRKRVQEEDWFDKGFQLWRDSASDDGESSEAWLCHTAINYEDDELVFNSQGSY